MHIRGFGGMQTPDGRIRIPQRESVSGMRSREIEVIINGGGNGMLFLGVPVDEPLSRVFDLVAERQAGTSRLVADAYSLERSDLQGLAVDDVCLVGAALCEWCAHEASADLPLRSGHLQLARACFSDRAHPGGHPHDVRGSDPRWA